MRVAYGTNAGKHHIRRVLAQNDVFANTLRIRVFKGTPTQVWMTLGALTESVPSSWYSLSHFLPLAVTSICVSSLLRTSNGVG